MISVVRSSLAAVASIGSHYRIDLHSSLDLIAEYKSKLAKISFPYIDNESNDSDKPKTQSETYDQLFDELDDIIKEEEEAGNSNKPAEESPGSIS